MSDAPNWPLSDRINRLDYALYRIEGSIACMNILAATELPLSDDIPAVSAFHSCLAGMEVFLADAQKVSAEISKIGKESAPDRPD
jgi:hypothetical protein